MRLSHISCENVTNDWIACAGIDAALSSDCPPTALNVSETFPLIIGDEVVTYGLGGRANGWKGTLVGYHEKIEAPNWNVHSVPHVEGEMLFSGHSQHGGLSGSGVLNGYGYVGMAHAIASDFDERASWGVVIPAKLIQPLNMIHFAENSNVKSSKKGMGRKRNNWEKIK